MSNTAEAKAGLAPQVRHTLGLDLGTSSLRLQVAHYDALGRPVGEPAAIHLPHSERDGVMPTVLQLSPQGNLLAYGRAAVQKLAHSAEAATLGTRFVAEFKPCIGQAPEDLAAQGRPEKARHCTNTGCPRPGWAWSVALQFCGFCGAALTEPTERWSPHFPYPREEALEYAGLLLSEVRLHLERRLNEPLRRESGWQVVAGVPVHWQAATRASYHQMLAQAFPEAGIALMSEPEGALRYYGCQGLVRSGNGWTLVVDFGAGTTDLVLGRVVSRGGESLLGEVRVYGERYGGADFDLLLAQLAAAELGVELGPASLAWWKLEAQRWKEAFSDAAQFDPVAETGFSFPVPVGGGGCDFRQVVMDRERFSRAAGELVERFQSVLERGLRYFGVGPCEITQVVLTGGGAQWYFVQEAVRALCPGTGVIGGVEPVRAIARGLALAPALPQLLEVSPRSPDPAKPEPSPETLIAVRGSDLEMNLTLTRKEAREGCLKVVVTEFGEVPVTLLPGTAQLGGLLRVPGGGAPGQHGGEPGDLLLWQHIIPDLPKLPTGPGPHEPDGGQCVQAGARATQLRTVRTPGKLIAAALSPDGATLATGLEVGKHPWGKGSTLFWDVSTGQEKQNLLEEIPRAMAFSADGSRLVRLFTIEGALTGSRISMFDLGSERQLWMQAVPSVPMALAYSPGEDFVVSSHLSASSCFSVNYWAAGDGGMGRSLARNVVVEPQAVAFSPDGSALSIACKQPGTNENNVRVYLDGGERLGAWFAMPDRGFSWKWAIKLPWTPLAFLSDGETLAVGSRTRKPTGITGRVYLFDWRRGQRAGDPTRPETYEELAEQGVARVLDGHTDQIVQVAVSPDGRTLASGSQDGTIILWDLESGTVRQTLTAHAAGLIALAFSHTGDRMMSASSDNVVHIWGLE